MSSAENHEHFNVEELWQEDSRVVGTILEQGAQKYFAELKDAPEAFAVCNDMLGCIDEGVDGDLNMAGSGVLLLEAAVESGELKLVSDQKLRAVLARMKKETNFVTISTHDGCGALGLFAEKYGVSVEKAAEFVRPIFEKLAQEFGLEYKHIKAKDMSRPPALHTAHVVYVDGTGHFNPGTSFGAPMEGWPKGFVISRKYLDSDYALEEVKVSIDIALGPHGFGNKFTEDSPIIIIAIGGDKKKGEVPLEKLQIELEAGLANSEYKGRFKIDGFKAPEIPGGARASDW